MKKYLAISILSVFICTCQKKEEVNLLNKTLIKLDSIQGKLMLDDRCGIDGPNIKIFNDSLYYYYYYYPTEGSYYRIDKVKQDETSITYEAEMKPLSSSEKKTFFKIINFNSNLYKLYIDNSYIGIFADFKEVGKKYKTFHRSDCEDDELDINHETSTKHETISSSYIIGTWQLDCEIPNSGIEIYGKENDLKAYVQLLPPMIFLEAKVTRESNGIYYLKFESQDMEAPESIENKIDESKIDKEKNIGKITMDGERINFVWYGLYDIKSKKLIQTSSQFGNQVATLKKCGD
jgi:hypothetical protein